MNVGAYEGESAVAAQLSYRISESLAVGGGVTTGLSGNGGSATRIGVTFGW